MSSFTDGSSGPQVSEPKGAAPPGLRSERRRSERRGKAVPVKGEWGGGWGPGGEREAQPRSAGDRGHWLAGRLAVVTGASRGIGAATAESLAAAGARVVLAARNHDALEAVAKAIRDTGGDARALPTDVASPNDVEELFAEIDRMGPLAALVCASAVLRSAPFEDTSSEIW